MRCGVGFAVDLDQEARDIRRDGRFGRDGPVEPIDTVYIPGGESCTRSLPEPRTSSSEFYAGRDRHHCADPGVMHDRAVVIGAAVQREVTLLLISNLEGARRYPDLALPIISLMLMIEPDRVSDLMNDGGWAAVFAENDTLFAADHAYLRRTSPAWPEANPVLLIRSFHKPDDGVFIPMSDCDGNVRVLEIGIDDVGNDAAEPEAFLVAYL